MAKYNTIRQLAQAAFAKITTMKDLPKDDPLPPPFLSLTLDSDPIFNIGLDVHVEKGVYRFSRAMYSNEYQSVAVKERLERGKKGQALADTLLKDANIMAIYSELEAAAIKHVVAKIPDYYKVFNFLLRDYNNANCDTLAVGWHKTKKRFILYINRTFVVSAAIQNLIGGRGIGPIKRLRKVGGGYPADLALILDVAGNFLHEVGHVIFRHVGKNVQEYKDLDHGFVNTYADTVVDANVRARIDYLIESGMKYGIPKDPQEALKKVSMFSLPSYGMADIISYKVNGATRSDVYDMIYLHRKPSGVDMRQMSKVRQDDFDDLLPDVAYPGILLVNPFSLVLQGVPQMVIFKIMKYFLSFFDKEQIKPGKKKIPPPKLGDPPPPPPQPGQGAPPGEKSVEIDLKVGDYVVYAETGTAATVTAVHDDGTYDIEDHGISPQELYDEILKDKGIDPKTGKELK